MSDEVREALWRAVRDESLPEPRFNEVVARGRKLRTRSRLLVASATAVGLAAVIAIATSVPFPSVSRRTDSATPRLPVTHIPVGYLARSVAVTEEGVWVVSDPGRVQKVDPSTDRVVETIQFSYKGRPADLWSIAEANGSLWVPILQKKSIYKIDPQRGEVVGQVRARWFPSDVVPAAGSLWYLTGGAPTQRIVRVDATSLRETATIKFRWTCCHSNLVSFDGAVWFVHYRLGGKLVAGPGDGPRTAAALFRINPDSNSIEPIASLPGKRLDIRDTPYGSLTRGAGYLWVARPGAGFLDRIDPSTGELTSVKIDGLRLPSHPVAADGSVWVFELNGTRVARVDMQTLQVNAFRVDATLSGIDSVEGFGSLWTVADPLSGARRSIVLRIDQ